MIVSLHAPRKEDTYAADAAAVKKSFKAGKSLSTTCYNCQLVVWIMSSGTFFHGAKKQMHPHLQPKLIPLGICV